MLSLHFSDVETSEVYSEISSIIHSKKGNLKAVSTFLARKLYDVQTGNSSEGTLLVARATCDGLPALALLKVENEQRVSTTEVGDGEEFSYDLAEISTLGMDKNRVFKAVLFVATEKDGVEGLDIVAADHQASGRDGKEMADFFLKKFLGCDYVTRPAVILMKTVDTIMSYISTVDVPPSVKTSMANALLTTIESHNPTFDIDAYISEFVPKENRSLLDTKLKKAGIIATEIEKDNSQIVEAKYLSVILSNGLRVVGPRDMLSDMVSAVETSDGLQELHITGTIVTYNLRKIH